MCECRHLLNAIPLYLVSGDNLYKRYTYCYILTSHKSTTKMVFQRLRNTKTYKHSILSKLILIFRSLNVCYKGEREGGMNKIRYPSSTNRRPSDAQLSSQKSMSHGSMAIPHPPSGITISGIPASWDPSPEFRSGMLLNSGSIDSPFSSWTPQSKKSVLSDGIEVSGMIENRGSSCPIAFVSLVLPLGIALSGKRAVGPDTVEF